MEKRGKRAFYTLYQATYNSTKLILGAGEDLGVWYDQCIGCQEKRWHCIASLRFIRCQLWAIDRRRTPSIIAAACEKEYGVG